MKNLSLLSLACTSCLVAGACGIEEKPKQHEISRSGLPLVGDQIDSFFALHRESAYRQVSKNGTEFELIFCSENHEILGADENDFPVGAVDLRFRSLGPVKEVVKLQFVACCGKSLEASFAKLGQGVYYGSDFKLGNSKHRLLISYTDGDQLQFQASEQKNGCALNIMYTYTYISDSLGKIPT